MADGLDLRNALREIREFLKFSIDSGIEFIKKERANADDLRERSSDDIEPKRMPFDSSKQSNILPIDTSFADLLKEIKSCKKCILANTRTNVVVGEGNLQARIVFVGEAPGFEEDMQGRPFVGRAGKLLDNLLEEVGLKRKDVYITNVVKCRPPENRNPQQIEISSCYHFLKKQLLYINPKIICALGKISAQVLINSPLPIANLRGRTFKWWDKGIPVFVAFHPAYILRNPSKEGILKADLKQLKRLADE